MADEMPMEVALPVGKLLGADEVGVRLTTLVEGQGEIVAQLRWYPGGWSSESGPVGEAYEVLNEAMVPDGGPISVEAGNEDHPLPVHQRSNGGLALVVRSVNSGSGKLVAAEVGYETVIRAVQTYVVLSCDTDGVWGGGYQYGFNGQRKTDEISGSGNHNTATFWEYDTRLAWRWNPDPVDEAGVSDYAVLGGSPIYMSDPDGDSPGGGCCDGLVQTLVAVGGGAAAMVDNLLPTTSNPVREWAAPSDPVLRQHFNRGTQAGDAASLMTGAMLDNIGTGMMGAGVRVTAGTGGAGAEVGVPMAAGGALVRVAGAWMFAKAVSNLASGPKQQQPQGSTTSSGGSQQSPGKRQRNILPQGKQANHVFSNKDGKFADTKANRKMIERFSNKPENYSHTDNRGKDWYQEMNSDGTQNWSYSQNGVIKGAGVNQTPRELKKTNSVR
ncbi:MAG: hypothetical protein EOP52_09675 [Sphingobacteriales bacterium]|nr:MAG: hypothetical protein EOP52_09675 [Sphingobacteriales bacterium]